MSVVTKPIALDETAQTMNTKLQAIADALTPNAGGVSYSNATSGLSAETVQEAIDEVDSNVDSINARLTYSNVNTLTLSNCTAGGNDSFYYKSFGVVNLFIDCTPNSGTVTIAKLPVGYRPRTNIRYTLTPVVHDSTDMSTAYCVIYSDGDIVMYMGTQKRTFFTACFST